MKNAHNHKLTACAYAVALVFAGAALPAQAAGPETTTWTGGAYTVGFQWTPPFVTVTDNGSDWGESKNWSNGTPDKYDTVNIDRQSAILQLLGLSEHAVVQVTSSEHASVVNVGVNNLFSLGQLNVASGGSLAIGNGLNIGVNRFSNGIVTVEEGGFVYNRGSLTVGDEGNGALSVDGTVVTRGRTVIGKEAGSTGSVAVSGDMISRGRLTVGESGEGRLRIEDGGDVRASSVVIADDRGSEGRVSVSGRGSNLDVRGSLTVGDDGDASLWITRGGDVTARDIVIADDRSSDSRVVVSGRGSDLSARDDLTVGNDGDASLWITRGAEVRNDDAVIADGRDSRSSVTVDGRGSEWNSRGNLTVGDDGDATLRVQNGADVSARNVVVADDRSSDSRVTVTGRGSDLNVRNDLTVGNDGDARLEITRGAEVRNDDAVIADGRDSRSSVTVDGWGSEWTSRGNLTVGDDGDASLRVTNGADVGARNIVIANDDSSDSRVMVSGRGSDLTARNDLVIGNGGDASLYVGGGANVRAGDDIVIADNRSSDSQVVVSGRGSELSARDNLTVGNEGDAMLLVRNGGDVSARDIVIADGSDSNSVVAVTGRGSDLTARNDLVIGNGGDASMYVGDGANVRAGDDIVIADNRSSDSQVVVSGRGSELSARDNLTVGNDGDAMLLVRNGGDVSARDIGIADGRDSSSLVAVTGRGSDLTARNDLVIGNGGNAALYVGDGASVRAGDDIVIADNRSSDAQVLVSGRGSELRAGDKLTVGNAGDARLSIENGADVSARDIVIANDRTSEALVEVTGRGSDLTARNDLVVGNSGNAGLYIGNGANVRAGDDIVIADNRSANAEVLVSGRGSELRAGDKLTVGNDGDASLRIENGADVSARDIVIADGRDSSSLVAVTGRGSDLTARNDLVVGNSGNAGLYIGNGANVRAGDDIVIADNRSADAEVLVTGRGSELRAGDKLTVGNDGDAALTVNRGATVSVGQDGKGTIYLAQGYASSSSINIGSSSWDSRDATWAGALEAGTIVFGKGDGSVNFNHTSSGYRFGTALEGEGRVNQIAGVTILDADSSAFTGRTRVSGGTLVVADQLGGDVDVRRRGTLTIGDDNGTSGAVQGDIRNDGRLRFDRSDVHAYDGSISGRGRIVQQGTGRTVLTGDSRRFRGETRIDAGTLAVDGKLGGLIKVNDGGTLAGNGDVRSVIVREGGSISPDSVGAGGGSNPSLQSVAGNSLGTLTVHGNFKQESGSVYQVDVTADGQHDAIDVHGRATLADGAQLNVNPADGDYRLDQTYAVLHANGGVTGRYELTGNTVVSTFYNLVDSYTGNDVVLTVEQIRQFEAAGRTLNQRMAAAGAQSLKGDVSGGLVEHNALFQALAYLPTDAQANAAFDQLSGEIYATARTAAIEDSSIVRDAINARLRSAQASEPVSQEGAVSEVKSEGKGVWAQGIGQWGRLKGNGNTATMHRKTFGFLAGADFAFGENGRLGALAGYTRGDMDVSGRLSSSKTDSYHLGVYGGSKLGNIGLRAGAAYSLNRLDTGRSVSFTGYGDSLASDSSIGLMQVFGEGSHRFDLANGVALEPYANLAYVAMQAHGFDESGGDAALNGRSKHTGVTFSTLGLRASTSFDVRGNSFSAHGTLGWRHAYGDVTPVSTLSFAGGTAFTVNGVPVARNAAVVEAGVSTQLAKNTQASLFYSGQFGGTARDNGLRVNVNYRF